MFALMGNCMKWANGKKEPRKSITLIVVGLDNAGKTTTVNGVKGFANDEVAPTMGFSSLDLTSGKFDIKFFDLGGGARIRGIWRNYMAEAYGVVYVIDSSDVARMDECKITFESVVSDERVQGKPILILANKQDKPGAIDESELCDRLNLEEIVNRHQCPSRVEHCTAIPPRGRRKPKKLDRGIKTGFSWLLDVIGNEYDVLHARISKDVQEQNERKAEERMQMIERVRKKREERERLEQEGVGEEEGNRSQPDGVSSHDDVNGSQHITDNLENEDNSQHSDRNSLAELGREALEMSHNQETAKGLGWQLVDDNESQDTTLNTNINNDEHILPTPLPGMVTSNTMEKSNQENNLIQSEMNEKSEQVDPSSLSKDSYNELLMENLKQSISPLPATPAYHTPTELSAQSLGEMEKENDSENTVTPSESTQPKPKKKRRKKKRKHNKIDVLQSEHNADGTDRPRPLPGRLTPLKMDAGMGNIKNDAFGNLQ